MTGDPPRDGIVAAWRRIERWIAAHVPAWANGARPLFNPPASVQALADLASHLDLSLPDQLRLLLLTNNGCRPGDYPLPMRATEPTKWRLLSTAEVAEEWDLLRSIADSVRVNAAIRTVGPVLATWWSDGWIPIADCGMGDVICHDMNPAPGGTVGQLILYEHDFAERKVLAPALADWISACADDLESGKYVYVAGVGLTLKTDQRTNEAPDAG